MSQKEEQLSCISRLNPHLLYETAMPLSCDNEIRAS